jgi:hypothetical protein
MNSDSTMSDSSSPENPSSDSFAIDREDTWLYDAHTDTSSEIYNKTAPKLDLVPQASTWNSQLSVSPLSTPSTSARDKFSTPIQWTNDDLCKTPWHLFVTWLTLIAYLLSYIYPDLVESAPLILTPMLSDLPHTPLPLKLRLFQAPPASPGSYSRDSLIGTGHPHSRKPIAESDECSTPESARVSLARRILANTEHVSYMFKRYTFLHTLYACSSSTLLELQRGMIEMLGVADYEWDERADMLCGRVDASCVLEARVEAYLLEAGRQETERMVEVCEVLRGLEKGEREVYGDAEGFLGRAVRERIEERRGKVWKG